MKLYGQGRDARINFMGVKRVIHIALLCVPSQVFAQNGNFLAYPGIFVFLEFASLEVSGISISIYYIETQLTRAGKSLFFSPL